MAGQTRIYGLIGFPLTHSFSESYFNHKFIAEHIDARYINFELDDIGQFIELFAQYPDLAGLNVTIPYKQQVIPYLDSLSDAARHIGAVNVIKIVPGRRGNDFGLIGHNSDAPAFQASIEHYLTPERNAALILGSGGAAKAVAYAFRKLNIPYRVVSRTPSETQLGYHDLTPEVIDRHKIIVNCTPVGMYPNVDDAPDIPYHLLTPEHLCYDLLYNPDTTMFMRLAREHGAEAVNGLEMLMLQAFDSWEIWNRP